MPSWEEFRPFIATGLALGGVYALSGVGLVVLYRTTGVLNLAFGAIGAMGALISWELINNQGWDQYAAYGVCVVVKALLRHTRAGELGVPSPDDRFTVIEVECLGACGFATPIMINEEFIESVTPERVPEILRALA